MPELPTGTIAFLFTDIEGSTRLWAEHPDEMRAASVRHDQLIEDAITSAGGMLVRPRGEGDSRFAVFTRATDAVTGAVRAQLAFAREAWSPAITIAVRMAVHIGEADLREGDYYGPAVNRCARLREIAHSGQTIVSQTVAELARDSLPPQVSYLDLGLHRLRDLAVPERVFQITHPQLRADFPPLRSLSVLPTNLPTQLTSFVGRETEMTEVARLLRPVRMLTLTGTGGCGKTRLALQVAADLLDRYADGVWLVELAGVGDRTLVPQAIATALGVREQPGRAIVDTLVESLRGKELLLILDNCEHVVDAGAEVATTLLRACPDVQIMATSREPLAVAGETTWTVPSMAVPRADAQESIETLASYEAVRLFMERAQQASPSLRLTERNAASIAQICHQLDGIPLAIELAAARAKVLSIEQIAARLHDRFRLLGESRGTIPRHETLAAAVEWSYDLLSEDERKLFTRLGVFTAGFTVESAEEVCAADGLSGADVLPLLSSLAEKSLVQRDDRGPGDRFTMLETVRQFAEERLAGAGERGDFRTRHAEHFADLADRAADALRGPQQGAWLDALEDEHDNVRSALEWSTASADATTALRLAVGLGPFWEIRGYLTEGRRWLETALALPVPEDDTLRAAGLGVAGTIAQAQGDIEAARHYQEQSLSLERGAGGGWFERTGRRIGSRARRHLAATIAVSLMIGAAGGGSVALNRGRDQGRNEMAQEIGVDSFDAFGAAVRWEFYSDRTANRLFVGSVNAPVVGRGIDEVPRSRLRGHTLTGSYQLLASHFCAQLSNFAGTTEDRPRVCLPAKGDIFAFCLCPVPWGDPNVRALWGVTTTDVRSIRIELANGNAHVLGLDRPGNIEVYPRRGEGSGIRAAASADIDRFAFLKFVPADIHIASIAALRTSGVFDERRRDRGILASYSLPARCRAQSATCTSSLLRGGA